MNCAAALEAMLDAEPDELAGQGTSSLAGHVATCKRCRAVAHQLTVDTRLLAASVAPYAQQRTRRGAPVWVGRSLIPVGLVAALLLVLTQRTPDAPADVTVGTVSPKPAVAAPDSGKPPPGVAATVPDFAQRLRPARVRAYPAPIPVAAVRISSPPQTFAPTRAQDGLAVIVDPEPGQRVAVMRTSNPKLTVVWLY